MIPSEFTWHTAAMWIIFPLLAGFAWRVGCTIGDALAGRLLKK